MKYAAGEIYHIYNRGNNRQPIFFKDGNYIFFLKKVRNYLSPYCRLLGWCLMPNHFHFLIYANQESVKEVNSWGIKMGQLSRGMKQLLSSYTKAINIQESRTGSLFQQKTKCVQVSGTKNYSQVALHYIHQNPLKAGLVKKMEDWDFSSFKDYIGLRKGNLCDISLAIELLDLQLERFYSEASNCNISTEVSDTLEVPDTTRL